MSQKFLPIPESKRALDLFYSYVEIQPNAPCIGYFDSNGFSEVSYRQVQIATNNAAIYFKEQGIENKMIVGYVGPTEVEYQINLLALMQLGAIPIALSPRNPGQVMSNLLNKGNGKALIYEESCKKLAKETHAINQIKLISRPELNTNEGKELLISANSSPEDTSVIIHSSGSTSEPKLVPLSHRYIATITERERVTPNVVPLSGRVLAYGPMFHLYGLGSFHRSLANGACFCLPSQATGGAKSVLSDIAITKPSKLCLLPFMAHNIVDYPETDWSLLSKIESVTVAGASFPRNYVKFMIEKGVTFVNAYGSSETGIQASCKATKDDPQDYGNILQMWHGVNYDIVNLTKEAEGEEGHIRIRPEDSGLATGFGDFEGYMISDRIRVIEKSPECFKFTVLGRSDDVLVHQSGEKTNPVLIEEEIVEHPLIGCAAIFLASNQLNACVLIQLSEDALKAPILEIPNKIWKHISKVNESISPHSRIMSDFIYILPFSSTIPVTAKGNLARARAAKEFADIIAKIGTEEHKAPGSQSASKATKFDTESIKSQIRDHYFSVLTQKPNDEQSFFSQGMDSLSAVKFRTLLNTSYPDYNITINILYEEDTIVKLSSFIKAKASGEVIHTKSLEEHQQELNETIDRFTNFPKSEPVPIQKRAPDSKLNVLITGANGSLGAFIIRSLFRRSEIGMVFGLARAKSKEEADKRVREGFSERYVELTDDEWSRFHNYPYDAEDKYLGMGEEDYNKVVPQVDIIYHNAWRMDFLKGLSKFEDLIQGTVNLLKISAESPFRPAFHFTSTVGAVLPLKFQLPISETKITPNLYNVKSCNGYNLSKLCSEVISYRFADHYKMKLNVFRVAQVGGDSESGAWNIREHVPLLIKAAQVMRVAPKNFTPSITWIPVDISGSAMVEANFSNSDESNIRINHIINPQPVPWSNVLEMLSENGLQFKVVPNKEFIDLLKTPKYQDVQTNPIASLTDYFTNVLGSSSDEHDLLMDTSSTGKRCPSIANCSPMNQEWINNYIKFWKSIGFME